MKKILLILAIIVTGCSQQRVAVSQSPSYVMSERQTDVTILLMKLLVIFLQSNK